MHSNCPNYLILIEKIQNLPLDPGLALEAMIEAEKTSEERKIFVELVKKSY